MSRARKTNAGQAKTLKENPNRMKYEPDLPPIGPVPSHLDRMQQEVWHEVVNCAPEGSLARSDRHYVEMTVKLLVMARMPLATRQEITAAAQALHRLGMAPSERSRVLKAPPEPKPEASPLDEFAFPGLVAVK